MQSELRCRCSFSLPAVRRRSAGRRPASERFAALESAISARHHPAHGDGGSGRGGAIFEQTPRARTRGSHGESARCPYDSWASRRQLDQGETRQSLDLVVLAAEWGHGRRSGWLSNLHLGARDSLRRSSCSARHSKASPMKCSNGRRRNLQARNQREAGRFTFGLNRGRVAFNEVQASSRYPGGRHCVLRASRGYRPDKRPRKADTLARRARTVYSTRARAARLHSELRASRRFRLLALEHDRMLPAGFLKPRRSRVRPAKNPFRVRLEFAFVGSKRTAARFRSLQRLVDIVDRISSGW